jgi:hypothetical protein
VITDLGIPAAERLAKLIRMLGSDRDGEVIAAVAAIRRLLEAQGLDLHDLADVVMGKQERRPNREDLGSAYQEGYRDGVRQANGDAADDVLSWREMASFCRARLNRLEDREADFIEQISGSIARGLEPSEKQARWLDYLYTRLKRNRTSREKRDRRRRRD